MKLSKQDAELFFDLSWSLHLFVNRRKKISTNIKTVSQYKEAPLQVKDEVRNALFGNTGLIDDYIDRNPDDLPPEHLEIVRKWKRGVPGKFFIERYLKKHAVFLSEENGVFGVVALFEEFEQMFPKGRLPVLVEAILLPFKGRIVYDGMLRTYNVFFGGGTRLRLKETYMIAKQNGQIVECLDASGAPARGKKRCGQAPKDWGPELEKLSTEARKLKGGRDQPAVVTPAFSLVKAALELACQAATCPDDPDSIKNGAKKAQRALDGVLRTLERTNR